MTEMLAVRAHAGGDQLFVEQVPVPSPGPDEVLVKVASAGLAPGMMALLARGAFRHLPTVLGHEAAGTVTGVGEAVTGWTVGDRVRIHPNLNCRSCDYCRTDREMMCAQQAMIGHAAFGDVPLPLYERYHDGGLAEYIRVPHWLLDRIPDNVGFDVAAKVHDLANAVRALKSAQLPLGATLVVTAATGTMGTATVKLAPLFGVSRLILVGRSRSRLEDVARLVSLPTELVAIEDLGSDWAVSQGLTLALRARVPHGVHAVVDFIPDGPATWQAMAALATGGTLVHMGGNMTPPPFPALVMMVNCWRFVGTRSCTRADARQVLDLLGRDALDIDELITHRFPLAKANDAVAAMQSRSEPMWMGVVNP
ncbi:alcohol dehydrogenase catalytic domain-containing protein [Streptomyces hokutonensis]|uniref:alcohol dehydrogenase catalytic domain-containing protein n=1 Tax=Streptomyces hokutonensis TaxID=1306990 RepID=UPI003802880F